VLHPEVRSPLDFKMPRLAYLLAASHSGSTLLAMLLGAHAEACTAGELKATYLRDAERYVCSCKQRIRECGFWREVSAAMERKGFRNWDITEAGTCILKVQSAYASRLLSPLHRGPFLEFVRDVGLGLSPAWRKHLRSTQERNLALVESLHEVTSAKVIVDSSKLALRLKYLLRNPGLDVKVIRTIRDGRAVALTYTDDWKFADATNPEERGGGFGEYYEPPRRSMKDAAEEWKRSNEASDCLIAQLPKSQWTQVRYEDLCTDLEGTLRRLSTFLGLDPDKVNLNFRSKPQHVIGNGMRMDTTSEVRVDERWKTHLSPDDLKVFDQVAGDLNRSYGYE
jgi:hypothetical protein